MADPVPTACPQRGKSCAFSTPSCASSDALVWMVIYGATGLFAGIAAWRPALLRAGIGRTILIACLVLALLGTYQYWPQAERFWSMSVWWEDEQAREGMGMMIVTLALLLVALPLLIGCRRSGTGA